MNRRLLGRAVIVEQSMDAPSFSLRVMMRSIYLSLLVLAFNSSLLLGEENWPGFRGNGNSLAKGEYPTKWSPSEGIAWKIETPGYGQSAPVVWNGTVYLTAIQGENREKGFILAYEAKTGKEKWRHTFEPTQKAKYAFTISRGAPTPCADSKGVYCFFEGGNLIALTHEGKLRWERSLVTDYGEFKGGHGIGASPTQTEDTLFVLIDHPGPCYLLAVDKADGKTKWKTPREGKMSWTSPVMAKQNDKPIVIASSNGSVVAYSAEDGKELWKLSGVVGNTLPSATVYENLVLVGAGVGRGGKEKELDKAPQSTCCLSLTSEDGKPSYSIKWKGKAGIANYASPIAHQGVAYFVNQVGVLFGYDLDSGKELFAERIDGPSWATPIAIEDRIYFFGKDGTTTLVKAGKEFTILGTNKLWESTPKANKSTEKSDAKGPSGEYGDPIVYGVAAADKAFFIRTGTNLFRIGKP